MEKTFLNRSLKAASVAVSVATSAAAGMAISMIVAGSLSGCSLLQTVVQSPQVKIEKVRVTDPSLTDATLMFDLDVFNPNGVDLHVDNIDYQLELNGREFAKGEFKDSTELPSQKSAKVSIPIRVQYNQIFSSLMAAFQKPDTEYKIQGNAKLGFLTVPFNETGKINWKGQAESHPPGK